MNIQILFTCSMAFLCGFLSVATVYSEEIASKNTANAEYAFALYQSLFDSNAETNIVLSPVSIREALQLAYIGAAGDTAKELDVFFQYSTGKQLKPRKTPYTVVNGIWVQKNYPLDKNYIKAAKKLNAAVKNVDFAQGKETETVINKWFADATKDLIPVVVSDLPPATRAVLGNAVYYKGKWLHAFNREISAVRPFYPANGKPVMVKMMQQTEHFYYAKGDNFAAVALPYQDEGLSLMIFLPDKKVPLKDFVKNFSSELLNNTIKQLERKEVSLTLPKFKINQAIKVIPLLEENGIMAVFSDKANFSKMTRSEQLRIDSIQHFSLIEVDEAGTEAAAATAITMGITALAPQDKPKLINFIADHPFVYILYDKQNDSVLFIGSVVKF